MATFELYSKRLKIANGDVPSIYEYNILPENFKVQIIHIIKESLDEDDLKQTCKGIKKILLKEYGVFLLADRRDIIDELTVYFLKLNDIVKELDFIELMFLYIEDYHEQYIKYNADFNSESIDELNFRFKENGIGYQYINHEIIRMDSQIMHTEITVPTIELLFNEKFKGANDEYMNAHRHYKDGKNKECLNDCLKAFESTMKIIFSEKGWVFDKKDTAKKLVQVCLANNLFPTFSQNQISALTNLLTDSTAPIRNNLGGHGQGNTIINVSDEITRYALNMTGANIIFLVESSGIK